jgi:hypothetical protein
MNIMRRLQGNESGFTTAALISIMVAMLILTTAAVELLDSNFFLVGNNIQSQKAFNIAEAGINYYLWHLSHNSSDYKDGQTTPTSPDPALGYGPYTHNYIDDNAVNEGTFTLWINPQGNGSTISTVRSIGKVAGANVTRTVEAKLGVTSFASYAVLSDSALWFGNTEVADGPIHSIKKMAFSSDASTSSLATQSNACGQTPVSRTNAYIPQRDSSANVSRGYMIELNTNGTYNLYTVNNEKDTQTTYSSALSPTLVANNIAVPSNGVIFVEDNVWVRSNPTFHGRVTIAAGRLATSVTANINVIDNLAYSAKDGSDAVGLIAEGSFTLSPYAAPTANSFNLEVDAAVIAQNGNVWYPSNYGFANGTCTRGFINPNQKLTYYGSIAVRLTWTWSWLQGGSCGDDVYDASSNSYISGFKYNTTTYDYNLLYAPPPGFPLTSSYSILSWREVLTHP